VARCALAGPSKAEAERWRRARRRAAAPLVVGPPKSRAGLRTVGIPATVVAELRDHMTAYTDPQESALVFTGQLGGVLRRGNFRRACGWTAAVGKLGVPGLHFHDLRHTGNTLAAPGTSLADLKARMGHDSARAAMIYQHATAAADHAIAAALDRQIEASGKG
jgi:integrase